MSANIQEYVFLNESSTSTISGEFVLGGNFQSLCLSVVSSTTVSVTAQCLLSDGSTDWQNIASIRSSNFDEYSTITANGIYTIDVQGVEKVRVINGGTVGSVKVLGVAVDMNGESVVYGYPLSTLTNPSWNSWINITTPISSLACVLPQPEADVSSEIRFTFTTDSTVSSPFFNFTAPTGYAVIGDYANPQILPNIVYQASIFSLDQQITINNVNYLALGLIVYPWIEVPASS